MTWPMESDLRPAESADIGAIADLWHEGWHDAHAAIVPAALVAMRGQGSFDARVAARLSDTVVAVDGDALLGMYMLAGDELYQFYLAGAARGTGLAARLIADAEARLVEAGVETAWLACSVGNLRAARFYEKCGWHNTRTEPISVETSQGGFMLDVWRYEKRLVV